MCCISVCGMYICATGNVREVTLRLRDKEVLGTPRNPKDWEIRQVIEKPW